MSVNAKLREEACKYPDSAWGRIYTVESTPVMWGAPPNPNLWHVCAFHHHEKRITIDCAHMEGTIIVESPDLGKTASTVRYTSGYWGKGEVVLCTELLPYKDVASQQFYWDRIRPHLAVIPKYKDVIRLYRPIEADAFYASLTKEESHA